MKRTFVVLAVILLGSVVYAQEGGGGAMSAEQKARIEKQEAIEKAAPKLQISEEFLPLTVPNHTIGETEGVAKDSKGRLIVYSRTGQAGSARGGTAAQAFLFDPAYKFVKMLIPDSYGLSFAHGVRVDKYDNIWIVDEGSGNIVKLNPEGNLMMVLGRKAEAIGWLEQYIERGEKTPPERRWPVGVPYVFNRPTDVTWDSKDNIYISDGYGNSRVAKLTKDGVWVKAVGTHGSGPGQFQVPHGITSDAQDRIYAFDRGNFRIWKMDSDLNLIKMIEGIGAPWGGCTTPGPKQYLFSGDGTGKIYKMDLDGNLVGWAQTRANNGQVGCLIHNIHCESENVVYTGSCSQWSVDKITIKGVK